MSTNRIENKKPTTKGSQRLLAPPLVKYLIVCPRCGGESDKPIRRGKNDTIYRCFDCNRAFIGSPPSKVHHLKKCPICDTFNNKVINDFEVWEKLVNMHICTKCEEETAEAVEFSNVVKAGGVYWACYDCKNYGVILPNDFAKRVREEHGVATPEPTGVIFTKENCPACRDKLMLHDRPATA